MPASRRRFQWYTRLYMNQPLAAGTQDCVDLLPPTVWADAQKKGATLTRLLLRINIRGQVNGQTSYTYFGVAMVNADAAAALAFPDADIEADNVAWLMRDFTLNSAGDIFDVSQHQERSYDLRGQRVWRSEQEELHCIFNQDLAGATTISLMSRILMRLP